MSLPNIHKSAWIISMVALPLLGGCGSGNSSVITGSVNYEGVPVPKGQISFYPMDDSGGSQAAVIKDGKYRITDVIPGRKRVKIIAIAEASPTAVPGNRKSANKDRLEGMKSKEPPKEGPLPDNAVGNNEIFDVAAGEQTHDFNLMKPGKR